MEGKLFKFNIYINRLGVYQLNDQVRHLSFVIECHPGWTTTINSSSSWHPELTMMSLHTLMYEPQHESKSPVNEQGQRYSLKGSQYFHLSMSPCIELTRGILSNSHCCCPHYQSRKQAAWSQPVCLFGNCYGTPPPFTPTLRLSHQLMITPGCTGPMLQQLPGSVALACLFSYPLLSIQ